jgi:melanoma-associated antigen
MDQREQLARKFVRYAISCEHSRTPIRRADVSAKVLGTSSRQFKPVFAEAQLMLQDTFGMEMVELPKAEKVTAQQKRGW